MVLRVLISTQETQYEIKGSPGGSLLLFLLADFLSVKFKLNVDLYDPIYNATDYINYSSFKIKKSLEVSIYLLKRYGLKFFLNKIKNKISSKKEYEKKQSFFIYKNNGNIYNERMENINLKEYIKIVNSKNNLLTTNPRIFILNNFINTKKINKTEICLRGKKDLLLFKDPDMIINNYENFL